MKSFYADLEYQCPHRGPSRRLNVVLQADDYEGAMNKLLAFDLGLRLATGSATWIDLMSMSIKPIRGRDYVTMSLPSLVNAIK